MTLGDHEGRPINEIITISATYGAGGGVVAAEIAEQLDLPLFCPTTPAERPAGRSPERLAPSEAKSVPVHRLLACLNNSFPMGSTLSPPSMHRLDYDLCQSNETELLGFVTGGRGVILGRAAAAVLGCDRGFHVRLDGPLERRLAQGAELEDISLREAGLRQQVADRARSSYARRLYHVDPADPSLYHLVIDSTRIPLAEVVRLIIDGVRAALVTKAAQGT